MGCSGVWGFGLLALEHCHFLREATSNWDRPTSGRQSLEYDKA